MCTSRKCHKHRWSDFYLFFYETWKDSVVSSQCIKKYLELPNGGAIITGHDIPLAASVPERGVMMNHVTGWPRGDAHIICGSQNVYLLDMKSSHILGVVTTAVEMKYGGMNARTIPSPREPSDIFTSHLLVSSLFWHRSAARRCHVQFRQTALSRNT